MFSQFHNYNIILLNSRNSHLRQRFPHPPGVPPSAVVDIKIWGALSGGNFLFKYKKKIGTPSAPQMVLKLLQGDEDSEYVLSFEIGQRVYRYGRYRVLNQISRLENYNLMIIWSFNMITEASRFFIQK